MPSVSASPQVTIIDAQALGTGKARADRSDRTRRRHCGCRSSAGNSRKVAASAASTPELTSRIARVAPSASLYSTIRSNPRAGDKDGHGGRGRRPRSPAPPRPRDARPAPQRLGLMKGCRRKARSPAPRTPSSSGMACRTAWAVLLFFLKGNPGVGVQFRQRLPDQIERRGRRRRRHPRAQACGRRPAHARPAARRPAGAAPGQPDCIRLPCPAARTISATGFSVIFALPVPYLLPAFYLGASHWALPRDHTF